MRIDKYLKVARVIKRRTIAKDILDFGFVKINGKTAKPSSEVNVDDLIELTLGERILTIRVKEIAGVTKKEASGNLFEIVSDEMKKED